MHQLTYAPCCPRTGTVSFLKRLGNLLAKLREINPNILYGVCVCPRLCAMGVEPNFLLCRVCAVCDPVLGDNGKLYTPKEFVAIYRTDIIPHATILTPNQTEVE